MKIVSQHIDLLIALFSAIGIAGLIVPTCKKLAGTLGLLDKPNGRKVHQTPIPVVGGLAIGTTLAIALAIHPLLLAIIAKYYIVISVALLLMLVGILDDKLNLKAAHRLLIQLVCAYAIAASGIRLTSLYGILGVGSLNTTVSYILTVFLITGVVNAFNLIDGIDGLAGFLALIGLSLFSYQAYILGDRALLIILITLIGSVLVFLFYNLGQKKIFLGDGGSLLLGIVLVAVGIQLIELANTNPTVEANTTISLTFGVFLIPVLDSLRVYWSRMNDGFSPFRADKRHIHHLFLFLQLSHKQASSLIAISAVSFTLLVVIFYSIYGLSTAIFFVSVLFLATTALLATIKKLDDWKMNIAELEYRD